MSANYYHDTDSLYELIAMSEKNIENGDVFTIEELIGSLLQANE